MEIFNLINSLSAVFIAVVALIVSFYAVRFQYVAIINAQLSERSAHCNSQLTDTNKSTIPKENDKISGILSGIITAEEILNSYFLEKNIFLWKLDAQIIIDHFYLQLHTTIRIFVERENLSGNDLSNPGQLTAFNIQLQRAKEFLELSIEKNRNKKFENLHSHSMRRNAKSKK